MNESDAMCNATPARKQFISYCTLQKSVRITDVLHSNVDMA